MNEGRSKVGGRRVCIGDGVGLESGGDEEEEETTQGRAVGSRLGESE